MMVKQIISNIESSNIEKSDAFYKDIFGLDLLMDHGWIRTFGSSMEMAVQISFASQGGSGTPVPDLSIEVDDLDVALKRVKKANVTLGPNNRTLRGS